jgi:hypothetical protein
VKKAKSATSSPRPSDAAVEAKIGKPWQEWFSVLDAAGAACSTEFRRFPQSGTPLQLAAGARQMDHQSIAAHLYKHLGVPGWWAQMVTVGYEQARAQSPPGLTVRRTRLLRVCYNPANCRVRQPRVTRGRSGHEADGS